MKWNSYQLHNTYHSSQFGRCDAVCHLDIRPHRLHMYICMYVCVYIVFIPFDCQTICPQRTNLQHCVWYQCGGWHTLIYIWMLPSVAGHWNWIWCMYVCDWRCCCFCCPSPSNLKPMAWIAIVLYGMSCDMFWMPEKNISKCNWVLNCYLVPYFNWIRRNLFVGSNYIFELFKRKYLFSSQQL